MSFGSTLIVILRKQLILRSLALLVQFSHVLLNFSRTTQRVVEYVNGESVTLGYSQRFKAMSDELMHQCVDTHHFCFLPSRCLEFPNCYNDKLAYVRAIYFYLCVCVIANFNFSGLDLVKPQTDLPTLVHIAPGDETNVFDAAASSLLQGSMLNAKEIENVFEVF